MAQHDSILIIDFGSQVTQLIARRIRETGVYCEIHPFQSAEAAFAELKPKGVIFSAGPLPSRTRVALARRRLSSRRRCRSWRSATASRPPPCSSAAWSRAGMPRSFGRADVEVLAPSALFDGVWQVGQRYRSG